MIDPEYVEQMNQLISDIHQNFDQVIEDLKSRFGATVDVELDSSTGVSDLMLCFVATC